MADIMPAMTAMLTIVNADDAALQTLPPRLARLAEVIACKRQDNTPHERAGKRIGDEPQN
jgi:hypothetical protein